MNLNSNRSLISMLLPQCQEMRTLAWLVQADARLAVEDRDGQRFVRDVETLLAMAEQLANDLPFIVENLIGIAVSNLALEEVQNVVAEQAAMLSDADLKHLAHVIARIDMAGRLKASLAGERLSYLDVLQRMYTDDGHGDGRLTVDGLNWVHDLAQTI